MDASKRKTHPRHVPERTCAGCRQARPKGELVRIVAVDSTEVVVDRTGRRPGRGTYLCKSKACWENGLKKDRLDRALQITISKEAKEELARYGETLPR